MSIAQNAAAAPPSLDNLDAREKAVFARMAWRILPLVTIAYIVNFLDRTNVSLAALTMNQEVGLTASQYGLGAGILFWGYCLFEIPSNVALYKFGARRWLARIMITWGLISMAMVFIAGPTSYYLLRFALGAAEAGFFPGAAYYLTLWFPAEYRARIYAWFLIGIPASSLVGGPLSSLLLEMNGWLGISGWKWLFLAEGAPAVILGILLLILLAERPSEAAWLTAEEKSLVEKRLGSEKKEKEKRGFWQTISDSRVLMLAAIQFTFTIGSYGVQLFLPLIIKGQNFSNFAVGFISAIPYLIACVAMVFWAGAVDRSGQKINNLAYTCLLSGLGLVLAVATSSFPLAFLGLTAVVVGTNTARAILWTIPTRFLSGLGAAGGLAFINTAGVFGGSIGPVVMGQMKDLTGTFTSGLLVLAGFMFLSMILGFCLKLVIKAE